MEQREKITVLHCTTNYPAQLNELNLRALSLLASKTGLDTLITPLGQWPQLSQFHLVPVLLKNILP